VKRSEVRNNAELQHLRVHLKSLLSERGYLPADLAAKAILPVSTLTRILHGQVLNPGIDIVISLAKALNVTVSELVGDGPASILERAGFVTLAIEGTDRIGILRDIAHIIADEGVNIIRCFATASSGNRARVVVGIETTQPDQVQRIVGQISETQAVEVVHRTDVPASAAPLEDLVRTFHERLPRSKAPIQPSHEFAGEGNLEQLLIELESFLRQQRRIQSNTQVKAGR
jgi:transcriptional regulator with XRE-family HTH domain